MSDAFRSLFSVPKWLTSAILASIFYIVILPHNESVIFVLPYESHEALRVAQILKLLFLPVLFSAFYFILKFIQGIHERNPLYLEWFKMSLIYAAIMLSFFLLLYPGQWVGDEFHILEATRHYSLYSWQNYLTNIFYTFSLYLVPTGVGIVVVQLGIISVITGYIVARAKEIFKKKHTHYLLFIPFLFFPVILNNLYALRLTMVSYLILLLIAQLIFIYYRVFTPRRPRLFFLQISFIVSVVSFWRSEGIIYVLLLPLFAHALKLVNKESLKHVSTYIMYMVAIAFFGLIFFITSSTTSDKYQITATLNPLSTMIQGKLQGKNINQDLAEIDKVINLSVVRQHPSYDEIPSFWIGIREDYYLHLKNYNAHVYDIFINNPDLFLSNRAQVFMHTNSFGRFPPLSTGQFYNPDPAAIGVVENFYGVNKFSKPWNLNLKLLITKRLLLVNRELQPTIAAKLVWSVIPTLLVLFVLLLVSVLRRRWFYTFIISLLIFHAFIVFLTAPASYFMYYLPVYLAGNFLIAFILLKKFEVKIASALLGFRSYLQRNLKKHRKYVFLTVGLVNTLLDFAFYTVLAHFIFNSPEQIGILGIISGTFALLCAYVSHRLITWRDKKTTKTTILKFFVVTGFGLWVIRPILLSLFITFTPLYSLFSHTANHIGLPFSYDFIASTGAFFMMVIILMVYNYITYGRFVFTDKKRL